MLPDRPAHLARISRTMDSPRPRGSVRQVVCDAAQERPAFAFVPTLEGSGADLLLKGFQPAAGGLSGHFALGN